MKWFKHNPFMTKDPRVEELIIDFGAEGYAVYWNCVEAIAGMISTDNICFELKSSSRAIARMFGMDVQKVENIQQRCVELGLFDLSENGNIRCLDLAKMVDDSTSKNMEIRKIKEGAKTLLDNNEEKENPNDSEKFRKNPNDSEDVGKTSDRLEEKREEENKGGGEEKPRVKKFTPPLLQEVKDYLIERKISAFTAEKFIAHYEARGWMLNKNKMKDWKAAVRTWEQNDFNNSRAAPPGPPGKQYKEFTEEYEQ